MYDSGVSVCAYNEATGTCFRYDRRGNQGSIFQSNGSWSHVLIIKNDKGSAVGIADSGPVQLLVHVIDNVIVFKYVNLKCVIMCDNNVEC